MSSRSCLTFLTQWARCHWALAHSAAVTAVGVGLLDLRAHDWQDTGELAVNRKTHRKICSLTPLMEDPL
jgi:hypothetical protein